MESPELFRVQQIDGDVEPFLNAVGEVFRAFREQDSGCVSFGVQQGGRRYFVKRGTLQKGQQSLRRAVAVNRAANHAALPALLNTFQSAEGLVLVYEWAPGELLGRQGGDAGERFRQMEVRHQLA